MPMFPVLVIAYCSTVHHCAEAPAPDRPSMNHAAPASNTAPATRLHCRVRFEADDRRVRREALHDGLGRR
jgi:hypothetical protein